MSDNTQKPTNADRAKWLVGSANNAMERVKQCYNDQRDLLGCPPEAMRVLMDAEHEGHEAMRRLASASIALAVNLYVCIANGVGGVAGELAALLTQQPAPAAPNGVTIETPSNSHAGKQILHSMEVMRVFSKQFGTMATPGELINRLRSKDPKVRAETEALCINAVSTLAFLTMAADGSKPTDGIPIYDRTDGPADLSHN